jgi:anthranilate synthase component 1
MVIFGLRPKLRSSFKNRKAEMHPIAGTFKELGMMKKMQLAKQLSEDKRKIVSMS